MKRSLFILFLLLGYCINAKADYPFSKDMWLNEANTPVKVNALVQDNKGYLWLGTDEGLYYFNGRSFSYMPDKIRRPVTALANIRDQIWAGFANGALAYVADDTLRPVQVQNVQLFSAITHIYSGDGQVLWLNTDQQGVILVVNNVGVTCNTSNGLADNFSYTTAPADDNNFLVGTDKGMNIIHPSQGKFRITTLTVKDGLPDNIVRVIKPMPDKKWFWIGTQQGGLALYNAQTGAAWPLSQDSTWKWGQVNDIIAMRTGHAWVATEDGYILDVQLQLDSRHINVKPYYYPQHVFKSLVCGRSGAMWAANNQGITSLSGEYLSYIPLAAPFKLNEVKAMTCDNNNMLWYAQGSRIFRIRLGTLNATPELVMNAVAPVKSLYADEQGHLWIGTVGKGLWYKDAAGGVQPVTDVPGLQSATIIDVTGTYDRLWVSSMNGVMELSYPGTYTKKMLLLRSHNRHSGVGSDYIYQLYPDRKGRIWMATDGGGVCMYGDGRYNHWAVADGLGFVSYTITEDATGNIWTATANNGLFRYDGNRWYKNSREQGLQDLNISTIAANNTGQVVVVHAKGIDIWYPNGQQFRNFNRSRPGNISIDSTSAELKLYANDKLGNIYIPYAGGFLMFKNLEQPFDIRPVVKLSEVSVFFKPVKFGESEFGHDQNHISFRFDGINFANPERLHYRYKLEGYNDSWIITNDESITFPQLPTGQYKFRVQASLNNTFNSMGEASYTFVIDKPFWQRLWFIILAVLVGVGIAYGYIRFREENLKKVSSLQRERLMFEYEHLKSQVNPHFLFNSLNTLTNLIEEDKEAAVSYTSRLSDLYRNMLSYRDKDVIFLHEEWEILENYMYIQQSRFGKALRLNGKVPADIMSTRKIVPMALQLLVENAIKHNVVSQSMPLTITIELVKDTLVIRNPLHPKISKEKGAGLGLINVRKRYVLLSKKQISYGVKNNEYIVTLPLL